MAVMLTYLAGVAFRPGAAERLAQLIPGEALRLEPEPGNPHDGNAVAVYDGPLHLGYVPRADAPLVGAAIRAGRAVEAAYSGHPTASAVTITWEST